MIVDRPLESLPLPSSRRNPHCEEGRGIPKHALLFLFPPTQALPTCDIFFSRFLPPVCNLRLFPLESAAVPSLSVQRMKPLFYRSSSFPGPFLLD